MHDLRMHAHLRAAATSDASSCSSAESWRWVKNALASFLEDTPFPPAPSLAHRPRVGETCVSCVCCVLHVIEHHSVISTIWQSTTSLATQVNLCHPPCSRPAQTQPQLTCSGLPPSCCLPCCSCWLASRLKPTLPRVVKGSALLPLFSADEPLRVSPSGWVKPTLRR